MKIAEIRKKIKKITIEIGEYLAEMAYRDNIKNIKRYMCENGTIDWAAILYDSNHDSEEYINEFVGQELREIELQDLALKAAKKCIKFKIGGLRARNR